jgi:hypothetical protein
MAMVSGIPLYAGFLLILSYPIEPWYYLPLMAVLAVVLDGILALKVENSMALRLASVLLAVLIALLVSGNVWQETRIRTTNVDLMTRQLQTLSMDHDLVVVYPWWLGISFSRYYKGQTEWVMVPDIQDRQMTRSDLVKAKMLDNRSIEAILEKITATFKNGHTVWVLGNLPLLEAGTRPIPLLPPPQPPYGWWDKPYIENWGCQIRAMLEIHGKLTPIPIRSEQSISPYEDVALSRVLSSAK